MYNIQYRKIIDIGQRIVTGKTPSTKESENFSDDYPFITPSDIPSYWEKFIAHTERGISIKGSKCLRGYMLPKDSICVVCIGSTIGKMCFTHKDCYTNQQINSIVPKEEYNAHYLFYLIRFLKGYFQLIGGGTGSGKGIVNKTTFSKIRLPVLTSRKVQNKIASILSTYDDLIEKNNRKIAILQEMAEELYKEWFVRFRFPGYKTAKFQKGIPEGWQVDKIKNRIKRLPFNRLYKESDVLEDGKVVVIDQSEDDYLGYHNNEPSHVASYAEPICLFGDHSCKFKLMTYPFSLGENVVPFKGNNINSYYLFYSTHKIIETEEYKRHWGLFVSKKILIPPMVLQRNFEKHLVTIHKQIDTISNGQRLLIKQRDLLLPRLMSGKLEVKV